MSLIEKKSILSMDLMVAVKTLLKLFVDTRPSEEDYYFKKRNIQRDLVNSELITQNTYLIEEIYLIMLACLTLKRIKKV